jgi:hypothetical protein
MVAANRSYPIVPTSSYHVPRAHLLAERLRSYFDRHPEVSREAFLLDAVQREIDSRERQVKQAASRHGRRHRIQPSAEDLRIHNWLNERLAAVHRERYGWWSKIRRFVIGTLLFWR